MNEKIDLGVNKIPRLKTCIEQVSVSTFEPVPCKVYLLYWLFSRNDVFERAVYNISSFLHRRLPPSSPSPAVSLPESKAARCRRSPALSFSEPELEASLCLPLTSISAVSYISVSASAPATSSPPNISVLFCGNQTPSDADLSLPSLLQQHRLPPPAFPVTRWATQPVVSIDRARRMDHAAGRQAE
ncbi:unnamed protein product [Cuscuta campestris]|uniref:Uncharacterized protein n=1 Tax=Cuscuta campestris TaxID=132261 RepID=A0A484MNE2_9ASTE|nr:unnamed protein product [Cuscuta campestris]